MIVPTGSYDKLLNSPYSRLTMFEKVGNDWSVCVGTKI